jgi:hypothetical protein
MRRDNITVLLVGIAVVLIWALSGLFLYGIGSTERGTFGDMFGASNALFSGLGLVGVIYAILLQQKQINDTNREYARNAQAQDHAAKLNALTVLFAEYKYLAEQKDEEFTRVITAPHTPEASLKLMEAVKAERDKILSTKYLIFKQLEEVAGLNDNPKT